MGLSANTTRTNKYVYANLFCIQHYGGVIFENHFGDMSCCSGQLWGPKIQNFTFIIFIPALSETLQFYCKVNCSIWKVTSPSWQVHKSNSLSGKFPVQTSSFVFRQVTFLFRQVPSYLIKTGYLPDQTDTFIFRQEAFLCRQVPLY